MKNLYRFLNRKLKLLLVVLLSFFLISCSSFDRKLDVKPITKTEYVEVKVYVEVEKIIEVTKPNDCFNTPYELPTIKITWIQLRIEFQKLYLTHERCLDSQLEGNSP